jgi:hypothetical protein
MAIKEIRTIISFDRVYGELIFKKGYRPRSDATPVLTGRPTIN